MRGSWVDLTCQSQWRLTARSTVQEMFIPGWRCQLYSAMALPVLVYPSRTRHTAMKYLVCFNSVSHEVFHVHGFFISAVSLGQAMPPTLALTCNGYKRIIAWKWVEKAISNLHPAFNFTHCGVAASQINLLEESLNSSRPHNNRQFSLSLGHKNEPDWTHTVGKAWLVLWTCQKYNTFLKKSGTGSCRIMFPGAD